MFKRILCLALVIAAIASFALPVSAAYNNSFSTAKTVNFGTSYNLTLSGGQGVYIKFTIPSQGVVNIWAQKPSVRLMFSVYDSNRNLVWQNYTEYAKRDGLSAYSMNVGLAAGTYYVKMSPSDTCQLNFSCKLSFTASAYCETENNQRELIADNALLNQTYFGWIGYDGYYSDDSDFVEVDCYKFSVKKGQTYRITMPDYIDYVFYAYKDPIGDYTSWEYCGDRDSNGDHYFQVTAQETGTAYFRTWGLLGKQQQYSFVIRNTKCLSGHSYQDTVTYPTAGANGYTTRTCTNCGYSYRENYTFSDVRNTAWYYNAVEFCVRKGYFSGYQSGKFGPADEITRQDFVVVLARISGVNLSKYSGRTGFKDVKAGSYYEAAIKWASSTGVVAGYKNGNFGVGDKLTREQLVTILYRYAQKKGCNVSVSNASVKKLNAFSDSGKITGYAKTPCAWALQNNVVSGLNATTFGPQRNANRAQVAQILLNICNNKVIPF